MEKIDQVLELLQTATPMLQEFIQWKNEEAERQKAYDDERSESQKEFDKWLKTRQAEEAQEAKDAAELKKCFYGGETWKKEHLFPKIY